MGKSGKAAPRKKRSLASLSVAAGFGAEPHYKEEELK